MFIEEKVLLIELLMKDLTYNWTYNPKRRIHKAIELCLDIDRPNFNILAATLSSYATGLDNFTADEKYNYFKDHNFPYGYQHMTHIHKLPYTFTYKSPDFKRHALHYLINPHMFFTDLPNYEDPFRE